MQINTVTVIGANGAMGSAVAAIFASFGEAKVYLICRDIKKAEIAIQAAIKSVRTEDISKRLIPKTFDDLKECIEDSQWVFESIAENYQSKLEINKQIAMYRKKGTIVSTGTSGLSIERLKEVFDEEGQRLYLGTHFFNPPYNLPLCEVIPTQCTNKEVTESICRYLQQTLRRKVVKVKDKPGFLANRVGFQFLNEALRIAEQYKEQGGVDYIDSIFCGVTGRGMSPLQTIDFVGLDIHKAIIENIYSNTTGILHDSFKSPECLEKLIAQGKLGRKVRQGLYKNAVDENGAKKRLVYDIQTDTYREVRNYDIEYINKMNEKVKSGKYKEAIKILQNSNSLEANICKELLIKYVIYAVIISAEISESAQDVEVAMVHGFNWISPIGLMEIIGGIEYIRDYIATNQELFSALKEFDMELFEEKSINLNSKEDYRKALRAH